MPVRKIHFLHGIIHAYVVTRIEASTVKNLTAVIQVEIPVRMVQHV